MMLSSFIHWIIRIVVVSVSVKETSDEFITFEELFSESEANLLR